MKVKNDTGRTKQGILLLLLCEGGNACPIGNSLNGVVKVMLSGISARDMSSQKETTQHGYLFLKNLFWTLRF